MAEKPEDLNLPTAVITRMIKEVLPEGVNISKEARAAISKSASVFVLYATSCANNMALQHKRKTLTATDVLEAVEEMEFPSFIKPLKEALEVFKREQKEKKDAAEIKKKQKAEANGKIEAEVNGTDKHDKKNDNEDDDDAIEVDEVVNVDESTNPYDADAPMPQVETQEMPQVDTQEIPQVDTQEMPQVDTQEMPQGDPQEQVLS